MTRKQRRKAILITATAACFLVALAATTGCALVCVERPVDVAVGQFRLVDESSAFERLWNLTGPGLVGLATASVHNHNFLSIAIDGNVTARVNDCAGTLFDGQVRDTLPPRRTKSVEIRGIVRVDGKDACTLRALGVGCANATARVRSALGFRAGPKSGVRVLTNSVPLSCDLGI
jgi:hypothetical protein